MVREPSGPLEQIPYMVGIGRFSMKSTFKSWLLLRDNLANTPKLNWPRVHYFFIWIKYNYTQ